MADLGASWPMLFGERWQSDVELFIIKYGALAVFLAAMIEADVVPALAGVIAHLGYVKVGSALFAATAGAFAGDYLWFCAGFYYSQNIKTSRLYRRIEHLPESMLQRLGVWQIPASHVVYGTRVATMIFWGTQRISTAKFALVDGFGCMVLTGLLFTFGFWFSGRALQIIARAKRVELLLLAGVILVFCLTSNLLARYLSRQVPTGERGTEGR